MVDEYQDTNHAQYSLIRELCGAELDHDPAQLGLSADPPELMVVGDSDQSIYAFRGATIRNILDFESDFAGARTILLEQNYRSSQTILSAANSVIKQNEGRAAKNLWSDAGDGALVTGYVADTTHSPTTIVIALFAGFALFSVTFWAYFRYRTPHVEAQDEPGWIEVG